MSIRGKRYNDPALGQAFENIASMFAPMSGSDLAGYANADLNRQKALLEQQKYDGITQLMTMSGSDERDRVATALGIYPPTQGYGARDMGDATTRRGQDLSLEGTKYTSDNSLKGTMFSSLTDPLAQGEIRPEMEGDLAAYFGLPGAISEVQGQAKPLSKSEVEGQLLQQYSGEDDAFGRWAIGGSKDPVAAVDENGRAVLSTPYEAAGMGVYEEPGAVKIQSVLDANGAPRSGIATAQGFIDPETQQIIPGAVPYSASVASADVESLGKTPTNKIQLELLDNVSTQDVGNRLSTLLQENPASQGVVGWLRSTAQDMIATGGEVGAYFGGETQKVLKDVTQGVADAALLAPGGAFDTSLPAIDMMTNIFVYNYAKSITGERLSNEAIKQWRNAMGLNNMFGNQQNTLARLQEAMTSLRNKEGLLRSSMAQGSVPSPGGAVVPPTAAPTSTPAPAPAEGDISVEELMRLYGG